MAKAIGAVLACALAAGCTHAEYSGAGSERAGFLAASGPATSDGAGGQQSAFLGGGSTGGGGNGNPGDGGGDPGDDGGGTGDGEGHDESPPADIQTAEVHTESVGISTEPGVGTACNCTATREDPVENARQGARNDRAPSVQLGQ
jgi:hypothetical protein